MNKQLLFGFVLIISVFLLAGCGQPLAGKAVEQGTSGETYLWIAGSGVISSVGGKGRILSTANGGTNWVGQVASSDSFAFKSIHFADQQVGVAVGTGGRIFITGDGGSTWSFFPSSTTANLQGVHCPSTATCTVVGDSGTVLKLTSDGTTWSVIPQTTGVQRSLRAVFCADENTCFAVGNSANNNQEIFKTTTGGTTWTRQTVLVTRSMLNTIYCADTLNCWAVGNQNLVAPQQGVILRTVDGGTTWTLQPSIPVGSFGLFGISFPTPGVGYIVGGKAAGSSANHAFLKSTDGGLTWTELSYLSPGLGVLQDVHFTDEMNGCAVGYAGRRGILVCTTNGGQSWDAPIIGTSGMEFIYSITG